MSRSAAFFAAAAAAAAFSLALPAQGVEEPAPAAKTAEIEKQIAGTWSLQQRQGERWASQINTYREDGTVTTQAAYDAGKGVQKLTIESKWSLDGTKLNFETIQSTDAAGHPAGEKSTETFVSLSDTEFRYLNDTGNERVERRTTLKEPVEPSLKLGFGMDHIALYQPDPVLRARIPDVDTLSAYIKALQGACGRYFDTADVPENLTLVVAIRPGNRTRIWWEKQDGSRSGAERDPLRAKLEEIPGIEVNGGAVALALVCKLAGGTEGDPAAARQVPMLTEWKEAAARIKQPAPIPDGILDLIWPAEK